MIATPWFAATRPFIIMSWAVSMVMLGLYAQLLEDMVGNGAQLTVGVKGDEILAIQLPQVHLVILSQTVSLGNEQNNLVFPDIRRFNAGIIDLRGKDQVHISSQKLFL